MGRDGGADICTCDRIFLAIVFFLVWTFVLVLLVGRGGWVEVVVAVGGCCDGGVCAAGAKPSRLHRRKHKPDKPNQANTDTASKTNTTDEARNNRRSHGREVKDGERRRQDRHDPTRPPRQTRQRRAERQANAEAKPNQVSGLLASFVWFAFAPSLQSVSSWSFGRVGLAGRVGWWLCC